MNHLTLDNLEDWSKEDLTSLIKMIEIFRDGKYSKDFYPAEVTILKNQDEDAIYMTNADELMVVYENGELVTYYKSPDEWLEGTFEELSEMYDSMSEEDKEWFDDIKKDRQCEQ